MVVLVVEEGFCGMEIPRGRARRRLLDLDEWGSWSEEGRKPGKVLGEGGRGTVRWVEGV